MTFVILTGGIDLSVGSVVALSTLLCAELVEARLAAVPRLRGRARRSGAALGLADGLHHPLLRHPAVHRHARRDVPRPRALLRRSASTRSRSRDPTYASSRSCAIALPGELLPDDRRASSPSSSSRRRVRPALTRFGRTVYAIGGNEQSALLMGLPVARTKIARLHDQRLLLGARRDPALASTCCPATALHADRHGARRDRRGRHRRHAADRRRRLRRRHRCSACSCSA